MVTLWKWTSEFLAMTSVALIRSVGKTLRPGGGMGMGGLLMVGYHKSSAPHTPSPASNWQAVYPSQECQECKQPKARSARHNVAKSINKTNKEADDCHDPSTKP